MHTLVHPGYFKLFCLFHLQSTILESNFKCQWFKVLLMGNLLNTAKEEEETWSNNILPYKHCKKEGTSDITQTKLSECPVFGQTLRFLTLWFWVGCVKHCQDVHIILI